MYYWIYAVVFSFIWIFLNLSTWNGSLLLKKAEFTTSLKSLDSVGSSDLDRDWFVCKLEVNWFIRCDRSSEALVNFFLVGEEFSQRDCGLEEDVWVFSTSIRTSFIFYYYCETSVCLLSPVINNRRETSVLNCRKTQTSASG